MKNLTIAIHDDFVVQPNGTKQSFSKIWQVRAKDKGMHVITVDHTTSNFIEKVGQADAFMWRFGYSISQQAIAKRIIHSISHGLNIPVYPSVDTCWHFEDKISQLYLLQTVGIPMAETKIYWSRSTLNEHIKDLNLPLIVKLSSGIRSENVCKLNSIEEVETFSDRIFGFGLDSLSKPKNPLIRMLGRFAVPMKLLFDRVKVADIQSGYVYLQEFLPNNTFDTRISVVGNKAFAYRRHNRPNDFRASGGGNFDFDQDKIDKRFIALAFKIAKSLNLQTLAIDGLYRDGEPVIAEISYTFAAWAVNLLPGYWIETDTESFHFIENSNLCIEEIIFDTFIEDFLSKRESEKL